jgi:hypothetical protein
VLATAGSVVAVLDVDGWAAAGGGSLPVDVVVGTTYPLVGALVLAGRRPSRRLGWLLLAVGAAAALTVVATTVALLADAPTRTALLAVHLQSWLWVPGFLPLVTLLPLLYPDGRPLGPRWRWAVWAAAAGMALTAAGAAAFPQVFDGPVPLEHPWTSAAVATVLFPLGGVLSGLSVLAGIASLVVRLRRSTGLARRQVVVLLVAAGTVVVSLATWQLLPAPAGTGRAGRCGRAAARGGRRRGDPPPAVRPRPRRLPGAGGGEPRRLPGRGLPDPVRAARRGGAGRHRRAVGGRGRRDRAARAPARRPAQPRRGPPVLRRARRPVRLPEHLLGLAADAPRRAGGARCRLRRRRVVAAAVLRVAAPADRGPRPGERRAAGRDRPPTSSCTTAASWSVSSPSRPGPASSCWTPATASCWRPSPTPPLRPWPPCA